MWKENQQVIKTRKNNGRNESTVVYRNWIAIYTFRCDPFSSLPHHTFCLADGSNEKQKLKIIHI